MRNEKNGQNYVMKLLNLVTEDLSNIMKEKMVLQKISGGCCEFLARVHDYVLTSVRSNRVILELIHFSRESEGNGKREAPRSLTIVLGSPGF